MGRGHPGVTMAEIKPPHDRVAVVTGAGSGIGRATAIALARGGWRVVFSGRRLEPLRESIGLAGDPHRDIDRRAFAVPADVTRPDAVRALFDFVRARLGRLDLLFNNAGCGSAGSAIEDLAIEQWRPTIDVAITGATLCTQQAFAVMKAQRPCGGRVINNGSVAWRGPHAHPLAVDAVRQAITGLTRRCAVEGRGFGIAMAQVDLLSGAASPAASLPERHSSRVLPPALQRPAEAMALAVAELARTPALMQVTFVEIDPALLVSPEEG
jgi:NAD(P)-dependent dehydrogenase (short-subunit alcohol dehydrogenase family)